MLLFFIFFLQKFNSAVSVIRDFNSQVVNYLSHVYRIVHQYREIRKVKDSLDDSTVIFHVDFSENYSCKWGQEVQSAHFGNRSQIVIHQGVYYLKNKCQSFCTLSDDTRKTSESIAAHLNAIITEVTSSEKIQKVNKTYYI